MSVYKGKNAFKNLRDQMIDKANFSIEAYNGEEGPEVVNFNFIEYNMYGTIDLSGSSIYPNGQQIKTFTSINNDPESFYAFDFVTQMFNDVRLNIQAAVTMGEISADNEIIQNMEIKRAHEPPRSAYRTYFSTLLVDYNEMLKVNKGLINNITSFDHYVKNFFVYLSQNYSGSPLTFSGYLQSTKNSIFSTGLALSIADIPFDDDDRKYEELMSSDLFRLYKKICLNRGFSLWKHCPYVLVADIGSPAIVPYINNSIDSILNNYYYKSYNIDNIMIKSKLIEYYEYFLVENPFKVKLKMGCVKLSERSIVYRTQYNPENFPDQYWVELYLDMRNLELDNLKPVAEIAKIKKYTRKMKKYVDNFDQIGYIDSTFREETFRKDFGFLDRVRRADEAEKQKKREEGMSGGSTILGGSGGGSSGGY